MKRLPGFILILMLFSSFVLAREIKTEKAVQDDKDSWDYVDDGMEAYKNNDAESARENFKKALEFTPEDRGARSKALYMLGETEYNFGKPEDAERYYRDCIKSDPGYAEAYEALAYLYFYRKKFDSSLSMVTSADTNGLSDTNLAAVAALDYASLEKFKDAEDAAAKYGRAFNFVKGQKDFVWGFVLLMEKKYKMAVERFGYAEEGYKQDPFFYYNFARAEEASGDIDSALVHAQRSHELEKGNTDYAALYSELKAKKAE
jgi:protein O-GlcNAc transferase